MPTSTTNYGLIKPGTDDPILIGQLNDNMDTIDTVLKDHSDKIDAAAIGIKFKGEVNYYADLPNNAEIGDAYTVKYAGSSGTTPDGTEYVWGTVSGTNQWINFSKDSYTKAEVDALLALKQNALTTAQLAAVNSGIDSTKVSQIETNKNNISYNTNNGVKNIWNVTIPSNLPSGFTITRDSDGGFVFNGNTGNSAVFCTTQVWFETETYVLSGCPSGGSDNSYRFDILRGDNSVICYGDPVEAGGFVQTTSYTCRIRIAANYTCNNLKFYPMICLKSLYDADPSYQPYALSNAELTAAIQALQAQLANQ